MPRENGSGKRCAVEGPRPLTHDGWVATITARGQLQDVFVNDLREYVYYAQARIRQGERLVTVDIRPSDGFSLAVLCGVPILVAERILAEACGQTTG
jgi:bifunctional DNase/RNase